MSRAKHRVVEINAGFLVNHPPIRARSFVNNCLGRLRATEAVASVNTSKHPTIGMSGRHRPWAWAAAGNGRDLPIFGTIRSPIQEEAAGPTWWPMRHE